MVTALPPGSRVSQRRGTTFGSVDLGEEFRLKGRKQWENRVDSVHTLRAPRTSTWQDTARPQTFFLFHQMLGARESRVAQGRKCPTECPLPLGYLDALDRLLQIDEAVRRRCELFIRAHHAA